MYIDNYGLRFEGTVWDQSALAKQSTMATLDTTSFVEFKKFFLDIPTKQVSTGDIEAKIQVFLHTHQVFDCYVRYNPFINAITVMTEIKEHLVCCVAPKTNFKWTGKAEGIEDALRVVLYGLQLTISLRKGLYGLDLSTEKVTIDNLSEVAAALSGNNAYELMDKYLSNFSSEVYLPLKQSREVLAYIENNYPWGEKVLNSLVDHAIKIVGSSRLTLCLEKISKDSSHPLAVAASNVLYNCVD